MREGRAGFHVLPEDLPGGAFAFGEDFADAADFGADGAQFLFNILVAAIDVIDTVDDGLTAGYESCEHQGGGGAQVGGEHGRGTERALAAHYGAATFDADVRTHSHELLGVHEAVFENVFRDDGSSLG